MTSLVIAIGTKNNAKRRAVEQACALVFPKQSVSIHCFDVNSGIADQPMTASETLRGARNRAAAALVAAREAVPSLVVDFAVGIEGGIETVDDVHFESGYIVILNRDGVEGVGTSARCLVSADIMRRLKSAPAEIELGDIIDELSGESDVRQNAGFMGIITNGALPRDHCYSHGCVFAFAPFVSDRKYWMK